MSFDRAIRRAAIEIAGLRRTYRLGSVDVEALRGIDLRVESGSQQVGKPEGVGLEEEPLRTRSLTIPNAPNAPRRPVTGVCRS